MGKTKRSKAPPAPVQPAIYYSLHTLLETIRGIKAYEDILCTLLHAIQTAGNASPEIETELQAVLDEMPAEAYAQELHGVRRMLSSRAITPAITVKMAGKKAAANPGRTGKRVSG